MRHHNWIVKDLNNKKQDCIKFVKDNTDRLSEDRILQIHKISNMSYEELILLWKFIPASYRSNCNLGCS